MELVELTGLKIRRYGTTADKEYCVGYLFVQRWRRNSHENA